MVEGYEIGELPRAQVLRYLGYRGQGLTPEVEAQLDGQAKRALELAHPRASWLIFDIAERGEDEAGLPFVRLKDSTLSLTGRSIARHLEKARACAVLAVTVGMDVERELLRLSLTNTLAELVFDACATVAVEQAADATSKSIAAAARERGLFANARFSPGYGDLPLSVQPSLLACVDAQRRLGITLSKSLLMTPTKSITALMGCFDEPRRAHDAEKASGALE